VGGKSVQREWEIHLPPLGSIPFCLTGLKLVHPHTHTHTHIPQSGPQLCMFLLRYPQCLERKRKGVGCSCTFNWQCHRGWKETKENALTHRSTLPRQQETKHYFARWGKGNRNEDDEWRIILLLPRKAMLSNTKLSIKVDGRPTLGRKVFVCCAYPGLPYVRDLIMVG
jgi:hypothetical protein